MIEGDVCGADSEAMKPHWHGGLKAGDSQGVTENNCTPEGMARPLEQQQTPLPPLCDTSSEQADTSGGDQKKPAGAGEQPAGSGHARHRRWNEAPVSI